MIEILKKAESGKPIRVEHVLESGIRHEFPPYESVR